jgi:predicted Fe-Mo cluster-binding NifX family protein
MKIAVPVHLNQLNPHFGQAQGFEIINVDEQTRTMTARRTIPADTHAGCGALPALLRSHGVDIVLCGGLGQGAKMNLESAGIKVVAGAPVGAVDDLVRAYLDGTLRAAGGVCDHRHADHHHEGGECRHGGHGHVPQDGKEG